MTCDLPHLFPIDFACKKLAEKVGDHRPWVAPTGYKCELVVKCLSFIQVTMVVLQCPEL